MRRPWHLAVALLVLTGADGPETSAEAPWDTVAWEAALEPGSWSHPRIQGDQVYVTAEPTRLVALDLATGAVRWSHEHPTQAALTAEEIESFEARSGEAEALSAELAALRKQFSRKRREIRRGKITWDDVTPLMAQMDEVRAKFDDVAPFFTPERRDGLGYAVPTPHVDDAGVVAAFGTGMVAARSHDGTLQWQRWLGVGAAPTRGYHGTDSASVVAFDDTVLVAHGALVALDRATGEERWRGPAYLDYGTPAVVTVGARTVVVTPDGHALDGTDGTVLATGLGDTYYLGPLVWDDTVWWVGRGDTELDGAVGLRGVRLSLGDDGLAHEVTVDLKLPVKDRVYAPPVIAGDHAFVATVRGTLVVFDRTGTVVHTRVLEGLSGQVWSAPSVVDGTVVVTTSEGSVATLSVEAPFARVGTSSTVTSVTAPAWAGSCVVVRDPTRVRGYGVCGDPG